LAIAAIRSVFRKHRTGSLKTVMLSDSNQTLSKLTRVAGLSCQTAYDCTQMALIKRVLTWSLFVGFVSVLSIIPECFVSAQEPSPMQERGQAIWNAQCVSCHGERGEGVPGKYEHRLAGPASLEELASLIEQTMPEDEPEKCVGDDARAVAEFLRAGILEEQAPPVQVRRELLHLTNDQYHRAVADVGERFLGKAQIGAERGLKARYFDGRNFDEKKLAAEQVDPQIDFDWQAGGPIGEKTGAEEYCVEWNGSIYIEETGEYDWIVRSPNGYRLYVNRQDQPVLDSWVATRDEPEKSVRQRLVGGRWYPIRLQALKVKDPTFSIQWLWRRPRRQAELIPTSSLAPEFARPVLLVQTSFPADDHSLGYARGSFFSPEWEEATTQAAWEIADLVVGRLQKFAGVPREAADFPAKCQEFCQRFAEAAFRRPLTEAERQRYVTQWFGSGPVEESVRVSLLSILKSPWFLYLGLEGGKPADQELAEQIALAVADTSGQDLIRESLREGDFTSRERQVALARELLDSPAGRAKWRAFFVAWIGLDEIEDLRKDKAIYGQFDAGLVDDLQESLLRFVSDVWESPESDYRRLLLSNELWVTPAMRDLYAKSLTDTEQSGDPPASEIPHAKDFIKVSLPQEERAGLLTHPLLLSQLAYFRTTSPIHRGVFVTRKILGLTLKPPPVAVEPISEEEANELTTRERVELQTRPDNCMSCHRVINPFGFALERYDAIGRVRGEDRGKPVDAKVRIELSEQQSIELTGARALAEHLVAQRGTARHFVQSVLHHAVRQPAMGYTPTFLDELTDFFINHDYNMRELVIEIAVRTAELSQQAEPSAKTTGEQ
jgi:mono/diheme cytochrome c family protein